MSESDWPMPETVEKPDGECRRVGIECELQGIEVDMLARLTALTLDGELEAVSEAEYLVDVPDHGKYRVEIDYALLKDLAGAKANSADEAPGMVDNVALGVLGAAGSLVAPCEVVTPPLEMTGMAEPMQLLTDAIREAGGQGTRHSPLFALGLHLNVEPPDLEADTVSSYMKAFACLYDWLVWQGQVDLTRRATPYIQRYPTDYDVLLTDPDYWPDWDSLIVDYLRWNATRNRAMDMLPMFSELNPASVKLAVDDDRVKSRPAFHYRLANCEIDDPEWSIAGPWRRWMQIEQLANDREALNACCDAYRADRERMLHRLDNNWRENVTEWIEEW